MRKTVFRTSSIHALYVAIYRKMSFTQFDEMHANYYCATFHVIPSGQWCYVIRMLTNRPRKDVACRLSSFWL